MADHTDENTMIISLVQEEEPDVDHNHFTWTKKSTKLFLQAYMERKERFRNPEVKKRQLWSEIAQILKGHGYINVDEDALDRKMRNMKRTFKTIKENNRGGTGRVAWEYYNTFQDIFSEMDTSISFSPGNRKILPYPSKKQVETEDRKIELVNQIRQSLEESNRIQQERNDLIRQLLLSQFPVQDK